MRGSYCQCHGDSRKYKYRPVHHHGQRHRPPRPPRRPVRPAADHNSRLYRHHPALPPRGHPTDPHHGPPSLPPPRRARFRSDAQTTENRCHQRVGPVCRRSRREGTGPHDIVLEDCAVRVGEPDSQALAGWEEQEGGCKEEGKWREWCGQRRYQKRRRRTDHNYDVGPAPIRIPPNEIGKPVRRRPPPPRAAVHQDGTDIVVPGEPFARRMDWVHGQIAGPRPGQVGPRCARLGLCGDARWQIRVRCHLRRL
mmetsp:Transcript_26270/g.61412  ORF Transcript_26270/g.61412 Transcript_26270/m.61412 type:complete len:252 (-) Transcript_26270:625-1380(-)